MLKTCLVVPFQLLRVIPSGEIKAWTIIWLIQMLTDQIYVFLPRGEHPLSDLFPEGLWVKLGNSYLLSQLWRISEHCNFMVHAFLWNYCFVTPWNLNLPQLSLAVFLLNMKSSRNRAEKAEICHLVLLPAPNVGRTASHRQCWLPPDSVYFYLISQCTDSRI